jgi:hypothetical protein
MATPPLLLLRECFSGGLDLERIEFFQKQKAGTWGPPMLFADKIESGLRLFQCRHVVFETIDPHGGQISSEVAGNAGYQELGSSRQGGLVLRWDDDCVARLNAIFAGPMR